MIDTIPKVTGIDASYYYASDLQRATKFYTDLLGIGAVDALRGHGQRMDVPGR